MKGPVNMFMSSQDEWDDSDNDESTDNHRSVLIIPHMTGDKTIVIDNNDVVT